MDTFEITIQRRDGGGWPVIVEQSSPGNLTPERSEGQLSFDEAALREQELSPAAYGRALGEALFTGPVYDAFRRALTRSEERLRVLLFIEDVELRALRWERLCAPIDDGWPILALSQRAPFSRYLPSLTDRRFPQIGRQELRALIVAASPANMARFRLEPFDVAAAVGGVQRAIEGIPAQLLSDLPGSAGPPSLDAICAQISAEPFTMLHIVCHGRAMPDGESVLFLARDDNPAEVDPVTASRLIERLGGLQGARGLPRLTFLSTCESASPGADAALGGVAQRLVRDLGMPAVVAMTDKVQIDTANALAATFYARLRDHGEVDRALVEASSGLAERGTILVPVLFSRLGGQPLFSDSLDRPLGPDELAAGLGLLAPLAGERAPVLSGELDTAAAALRRTLRADPGGLSGEARQERAAALAAVETICAEACELSFQALARGQRPPPYDGRCPFPGLRSFKADARDFFFGREPLVRRLAARLAEQPFLAVLGASGSGKSSLVFAGLLPALQAERPLLRAVTLTPGERPLEALEHALGAGDPGERIVVIDQFEEAFTLCQDGAQRAAFFAALLALGDSAQVVITMRADFLGEVAPYPALRDAVQGRQELVAPMSPEELRRAMELQAAAVGLRFEADLGGQILDDVRGEPGAMPLLQHALQELWQRRRGRWLRAAEYRNVGGIHQAIAHSADQIYESCAPADKERLRGIFVRLTRIDREALAGEERRDTRQRVTLRDLTPVGSDPAPLRELLRRLADARLVVTGVSADGDETVEVAHEALIRSWPRLRAWLEEDRAGLLLRDSIRTAALEWQREDGDPALLFRGGRLDEALALAELPRFAPNQLERSFLDTSVALREQEAAEREAARQRELEQARALAAEQQRRAEEQAAAAARLRRRAVFLAGVAGVALVAMVAAVFLGLQAQRSEQAAQASAAEANQRALIANAQAAAGEGRPSLALALSLQAAESATPLPGTTGQLAALAENAARRRLAITTPGGASGLAFSPRGDELLVSTYYDIQVWGADDITYTRRLSLDMIGNLPPDTNPSYGGIWWAALSPDGATVLATTDYSLLGWGLAGGQSYQSDLGDDYPLSLAVLPDSHTVALLFEREVRIFDLHTRAVVRSIAGPEGAPRPTMITVSADGAQLAVAYDSTFAQDADGNLAYSEDGATIITAPPRLLVWDLSSDSPTPRLTLEGHANEINAVTFSPDGSRLASASRDFTARVWDLASGAELLTMRQGSNINSVAFSPDGGSLVTSDDDGLARIWDMRAGAEIRRFTGDISNGRPQAITGAIFSPDGARVAAIVGTAAIYVWDVAGYELAADGWPGDGAISVARFGPDGAALVGGSGGLARLGPDAPLSFARQEVDGQVADISPDGTRGLILRDDPNQADPNSGMPFKTVGVWDLAGGEVRMGEGSASVALAGFTPDGQTIVCVLGDGRVQFRDGGSAALLREGGPIAFEAGPYRLSPDRSQVVVFISGGGGGTGASMRSSGHLTIWDIASGTKAGEIDSPDTAINGAAYSPDGSLLAVGYFDATIKIWRLEDMALLKTLAVPSGGVTALAFGTDGEHLLSGGGRVVRLWDWRSGEELRSLTRLATVASGANDDVDGVGNVALSPNGDMILATSWKGALLAWRNDSGTAFADWVRASRYLPELSCDERARYGVPPLCASAP